MIAADAKIVIDEQRRVPAVGIGEVQGYLRDDPLEAKAKEIGLNT